jgi:hypothetical protein
LLDEILDLAPTLADQADHNHVCAGIARHHAQQNALSHSGTGKQPHALAPSNGKERIDGAHTHVQYFADRGSIKWVDRLVHERRIMLRL